MVYSGLCECYECTYNKHCKPCCNILISWLWQTLELENVTIDDVLLLKATRRDAIANLKWLWEPQDTSDLTVSFTFTMRRDLIRLASTPFTSTSSRLAKFGFPFAVCNAWQRSRMKNIRRVGENCGSIFTLLWTKVHEIFRRCRKPFVLCNNFARLSISRFIQKIFAIMSRSRWKPNKCIQVFVSFWEKQFPTFLRHIVIAIYSPSFGKV